eukprot:scaffold109743_cov31-Tisochrysis_lutea.AAC.1
MHEDISLGAHCRRKPSNWLTAISVAARASESWRSLASKASPLGTGKQLVQLPLPKAKLRTSSARAAAPKASGARR